MGGKGEGRAHDDQPTYLCPAPREFGDELIGAKPTPCAAGRVRRRTGPDLLHPLHACCSLLGLLHCSRHNAPSSSSPRPGAVHPSSGTRPRQRRSVQPAGTGGKGEGGRGVSASAALTGGLLLCSGGPSPNGAACVATGGGGQRPPAPACTGCHSNGALCRGAGGTCAAQIEPLAAAVCPRCRCARGSGECGA